MSFTLIPVDRSRVRSRIQSRSRGANLRRPSAPRSMRSSSPIRSYQRSVCSERPHLSATSRMPQLVTASTVGVRVHSNASRSGGEFEDQRGRANREDEVPEGDSFPLDGDTYVANDSRRGQQSDL